MQVLEAGHVAAHDDEVHALGVLDVEVAHGLAAAVDDPEGQLERLALRRGAASELEREALLADREAAHRLRRHLLLAVAIAVGGHRAHAGLGGSLGLAGVDVDPAAGERGAGEDQRQHDGEPGEPGGDVHAVTCWRPCSTVGRSSITPAMASSITTCSMTISADVGQQPAVSSR